MENVRRCSIFAGPVDADGVQVGSGQDEFGRELPDPVPLAPPVGYRAGPSLADLIKRMVTNELINRAIDAEGFDTFEEAEDFDVDEDNLDPHTVYEAVFDPPLMAPGAVKQEGGDPSHEPVVERAVDDPSSVGADRSEGGPKADPGSAPA